MSNATVVFWLRSGRRNSEGQFLAYKVILLQFPQEMLSHITEMSCWQTPHLHLEQERATALLKVAFFNLILSLSWWPPFSSSQRPHLKNDSSILHYLCLAKQRLERLTIPQHCCMTKQGLRVMKSIRWHRNMCCMTTPAAEETRDTFTLLPLVNLLPASEMLLLHC